MSKHTPPPWYRNIRANGKYPVVFAGRNQHIATVSQQRDGAETEANIDLIAAAPELLAALRDLVEQTTIYINCDDADLPDVTRANAAIAKAVQS